MIGLKSASIYDMGALYDMWSALVSYENDISGKPPLPVFDRDEWADSRIASLNNPAVSYTLAVDNSLDKVVGYVLGSLLYRSFGEHKAVLEIHEFYVIPEFRSGSTESAAKLLENAITAWGISNGCTSIECNAVPANVRRWTRKGFGVISSRLRRDIKYGL